MKAGNDIVARTASAWYRQPVLWLGAFIFVASLAGCVWIIVLGANHADTPLDTPHTVFGVPVSAHSSATPPHPPTDPPR
ncbi:MAG: hypothetical protein WBG81_03355 [Rhodanobacter sp.]|jgi:hypothetical protein|uniref:hypothetical protein n=1 Tax=Rhodanobacter sp. KK11 TaxID=3083255 RepID=UPI002965DABD|nr:hypothetical protein [Rhodanobacter sp. KK11]MDW2981582.1 hypothetical protein [Rhodanobacter sp. KK11]